MQIVQDRYNEAKLKVHIRENSGREFRYIPITDLGFYEYAINDESRYGALNRLNDFLHSQEEIFVRIGLGRRYKVPDGRDGFWIQANGIYTFPECPEGIRCYRRG